MVVSIPTIAFYLWSKQRVELSEFTLDADRQPLCSFMKSKKVLHFSAVQINFQIWICFPPAPSSLEVKLFSYSFMLWKEMAISTGPFPLKHIWTENRHNYLLHYFWWIYFTKDDLHLICSQPLFHEQNSRAEPDDLRCQVTFPALCRTTRKARWKLLHRLRSLVPSMENHFRKAQLTVGNEEI